MRLNKHLKLFRKLLGAAVRRKYGLRNQIVKLAKILYLLLTWVFEGVGDTLILQSKQNPLPDAHPRRILVVKTDQLGDVMFSTLLLPSIRRKFPEARVDYLVRPGAKSILEKNPDVSTIYPWHNMALEFLPGRGNRRRLLQRLRENRATKQLLRSNQYDVVINARAYPPSSNIQLKGIGKKLIAFDISEQSFVADFWAPYDLEAEEWENYAHLLAPLAIPTSEVFPAAEFFNYDAQNPMEKATPYAVLSPISFEVDRQWSNHCWKELIAHLVKNGLNVALTGMPHHKMFLSELLPDPAEEQEAVHLFTGISICEFGALVKGALCFVGIESFPAHLAIALRKQVALLINPQVYYLKGYSSRRFANEARSMLPVIESAAFLDIRHASADQVADVVLDNMR